jgi:hypothetical protein
VAAERILSADFKDLRLGLRLTHFRRHYCKYEMQNFLADCLDGYIPSSRDLRCKGLGRDDRIDGLDSKEYRMSRLSETRLLTQTYRVNPDQNRSKEDGDPHPYIPRFGVQSGEYVGDHDSTDYHDLFSREE